MGGLGVFRRCERAARVERVAVRERPDQPVHRPEGPDESWIMGYVTVGNENSTPIDQILGERGETFGR